MASLSDLRVCKSCGNVFSKKAGISIITECPHCQGIAFESVELRPNSEYEEKYLDELD